MSLEAVAELVVRDLADELREHLVGQLLLDVEDVSELVQEELAGIRDLGHGAPFLVSTVPGRYPDRRPRNRRRFRVPRTWKTTSVDEKRAAGSIWHVLRRAFVEARDDDVPMVARALAYSLFLAIPAAALLALGVFSLVADTGTVEELVARLQTVMPEEATTLLSESLERSTQSHRGGVAMTIAGLVLALWTTTSAASTLMSATTRAFDRKDGEASCGSGSSRSGSCWRSVSVRHSCSRSSSSDRTWSAGSAVRRASRRSSPRRGGRSSGHCSSPESCFAFAVALALGPDVDQRRWQLVTPGAVTALVLWLLASSAFAIYTSRFGSYDKSWGTISAVVVTLVWLWLTSAALLFGAEINAEAQRLEERGRASERAA